MATGHYRLVTRSDFDGLVCGLLLREAGLIDEIKFVHPKDMQDGTVPITDRDIITNLPYVEGCHLAFDHHASEVERNAAAAPRNHIIDAERRLRRPGGVRLFRWSPHLSPRQRGHDAGGGQGGLGAVLAGGDPRPAGLGAAQLPDGPAHRARPASATSASPTTT